MAFTCILSLKNECDGCGACDERYYDAFDDDEYDPFEIEYDDEE